MPDITHTEEAEDDRRSRARCSESTVSQIEAPASASQLYHATLIDNSTLDNILAAFEADEGTGGIVVDRILIRHGVRDHLRLDVTDQQKRLRYRNPSTRNISGGADLPRQTYGNPPGSDAQPSPHPRTSEPETPSPETARTLVRTQADCNDNLRRNENSPDSNMTCEHGTPNIQSPERHLSLHTLNRCPKFVRRHAQSLLPRRSVSGDKQPLAVLKQKGAKSSPELPSSTPTKPRARLQRRVAPKQSQAKIE